jgi:two-component system response regulator MprA
MESIHISKGRILYTEDDPDSREMLVLLLKHRGYDVTVTASAEHALAVAKRERFDLLLVDNWMPGLTGQDLTREVRKFDQSTPILFYSGAAYETDKKAAIEAGAQGYLVKPSDLEFLLDEVGCLIAEAKIAVPLAFVYNLITP